MATVAYLIKGCAGQLKLLRRGVWQPSGWEDDWDWHVYVAWVAQALALALLSVLWTHLISPAAAGSGIAEMRTTLSGVTLEAYLSLRTLVAKVGGLTIGLGSGLPIGSEGPFCHIAAAIGAQMCRLPGFAHIRSQEASRRAVIAASCAVGVGCCFGSVIGGILYSMETTSAYYDLTAYWQALYCATWGSVVLRLWESTGIFPPPPSYAAPLQPVDLTELPMCLLVGVVGGALGAGFVWLNEQHIAWRARSPWLRSRWWSHVLYPALVTVVFATMAYPPIFGGFLPAETAALGDLVTVQDIETKQFRWPEGHVLGHLAVFFALHFLTTCATISLPFPVGVYFPCLNVGAGYGRLCGEYLRRSGWPATEPRLYAILGAGAFTVGVTRTVSTVVILVSLTEQFLALQPILVATVGAYLVSNLLCPSVYDTIARLKRLPYLPALVTFHPFEISAETLMQAPVWVCPDMGLADLTAALAAADRAGLHCVALVDGPKTRRLTGALPVAALQALRDGAEFHTAGSHTSRLSAMYRVEFSRVDGWDSWRIHVSLRELVAAEHTALIGSACQPETLAYCSDADVFVPTDGYVDVDPVTPSSAFTACPTSSAMLGGASRRGAHRAVRPQRRDLPPPAIAAAAVDFAPGLVDVPHQVAPEEGFASLHRRFLHLSLREVFVCRHGALEGVVPRSAVVDVLNAHSRGWLDRWRVGSS
eukprot:EG_transcript_4301